MRQIPLRGFYLQPTFARPPPSPKNPPKKTKKNIPPSAYQACRGADRVALAQPHVDDPQDTDLQEHEKALHGKRPFIGANPMIMVPEVEVKRRKQCLVVLIPEPGL